MELTGSHRMSAPREVVWAGLNDPRILKACIPGCQSLEKLSETEVEATVLSKIGPLKVTFAVALTLENLDPFESYSMTGQAMGGSAGFAKGGAEMALAADGGATVLSYLVRAEVGGKIAQLGSRLVDGVARQTAEAFFANFEREVGGRAVDGGRVASPPLADAPPMVHEEPADAGPPPVLDAPPLAAGTSPAAPPPPDAGPLAPSPQPPAEQAKAERDVVTAGSSSVGRLLFVAAVVIVIGFFAYNLLVLTPA